MAPIRQTAKSNRRFAPGTICAFVAALVLAVADARASVALEVRDVRVGEHSDKTRFVLDLSDEASYRIFTLADPYRVVIDLPEVRWPGEVAKLPERSGLIRELRYGLFTPGTSRVVLDIAAPVEIAKVFQLPPAKDFGHRLVVDLTQVDRQRFMAARPGSAIQSATPLPLPQTALLAPRRPQDLRPTVVIDAGHGGVDPGAIGVSGTHEKDLALRYALSLRDALEAKGRYRVVLTRDSDYFIPLRRRVALAEQAEGDLFISLHANTHPSRQIKGASVYTLSETASDAEAAQLAAKENKADVIAGVDLSNQNEVVSQILIDLAQRESMNVSKSFASELVGTLGERVTLLRNTHRFAGFVVLKSATVPSVLVEIGYMSHKQEERLLKSPEHRAKIVSGITAAVERHFGQQQARR